MKRGPIEIEKLGLKYYGAGRKFIWPLIFFVLVCAWMLVNRGT